MCRTYRVTVSKEKSHHKNAIPYNRTAKHKSSYNEYEDYNN